MVGWVGWFPKPAKKSQKHPENRHFDPNFTFCVPNSHKNPWVGSKIWESSWWLAYRCTMSEVHLPTKRNNLISHLSKSASLLLPNAGCSNWQNCQSDNRAEVRSAPLCSGCNCCTIKKVKFSSPTTLRASLTLPKTRHWAWIEPGSNTRDIVMTDFQTDASWWKYILGKSWAFRFEKRSESLFKKTSTPSGF